MKRWNKVEHEPYTDPGLRSGLQTQLIHTWYRENPTHCHKCGKYIWPGEQIVRTTRTKKSVRTTYHQRHYQDAKNNLIYPTGKPQTNRK